MKQQIFIIVGALIILTLVLVWAYLLFFRTPGATEEVYSELGQSGSEDNTNVVAPVVKDPTVVNMERAKLRQLTTKPVAGFREISYGTSTPAKLMYVERGTGHIYTINLESGEETRVSGTTVAGANEATLSPQGDFVAIAATGNTKSKSLVVGELSTSSESFIEKLALNVQDFSIEQTNEVLYTIPDSQGLVGRSYNLNNNTDSLIFNIPFHEATVLWGNGGGDTHYAYPKATYALESYLYEVSGDVLKRLPLAGFGFGARVNNDFIVYNATAKQTPTSYIYNRETGVSTALNSPVLLEKCYLPESGFVFICGFEPIKVPYEFPDVWYRGDISFKDSILAFSATDFVSEELVNTFTESGREIDIMELKANTAGTALYLTNKNDNSLWMYEI